MKERDETKSLMLKVAELGKQSERTGEPLVDLLARWLKEQEPSQKPARRKPKKKKPRAKKKLEVIEPEESDESVDRRVGEWLERIAHNEGQPGLDDEITAIILAEARRLKSVGECRA